MHFNGINTWGVRRWGGGEGCEESRGGSHKTEECGRTNGMGRRRGGRRVRVSRLVNALFCYFDCQFSRKLFLRRCLALAFIFVSKS